MIQVFSEFQRSPYKRCRAQKISILVHLSFQVVSWLNILDWEKLTGLLSEAPLALAAGTGMY